MRCNALVPELYCSDFGRSLVFYTEVLGFQVLYARPEEKFAFLEREGAQLMIEEPTNPARTWLAGALEAPYGRGVNLQIAVGNIHALYEAVQAAGVFIQVPLEDKWYRRQEDLVGNRQLVLRDPDGYLLRFFMDLGAKPI